MADRVATSLPALMRSGVWYSGVQEDQVIKRLVACMWCDREGLFIISVK